MNFTDREKAKYASKYGLSLSILKTPHRHIANIKKLIFTKGGL